MAMISTLLSIIFLLFIPLQPWDPLLLIPLKIQLPPLLVLLIFVLLPPAAIPPVLLYSLHAMEKADLSEIPPRRSLLTTPTSDPGTLPPTQAAAWEFFIWEFSAALIGGGLQLAVQIQDDEVRARPLNIFYAVLFATAISGGWHRHWARMRLRFSDSNPQQDTPEQQSRDGRLPTIPWTKIRRLTALAFFSAGWVWVAMFIVASPTSRPHLQVRLQVAAMIQASLLLVNIGYDSAAALLERLWRQPLLN